MVQTDNQQSNVPLFVSNFPTNVLKNFSETDTNSSAAATLGLAEPNSSEQSEEVGVNSSFPRINKLTIRMDEEKSPVSEEPCDPQTQTVNVTIPLVKIDHLNVNFNSILINL